jgi:hypothetical protein
VLNRIGTIKWVPTTHSSHIATGLARFIYSVGTRTDVDYGFYIFDQTMQHGKSWALRMPIAFPSLMCGIILSQHPNILTANDEPCKRESHLSLHFKLFEGNHAADIAGLSRKVTPSTMSRKEMIASMEATCRALDEQKKGLEQVILALKQEEAEEEAEGVDADDAAMGDKVVGDAIVDDEAVGDTEELEVADTISYF